MNKLIDNLPYITKDLEEKGLFAYLVWTNQKRKSGWKIRKYISICNAPSIWAKMKEGDQNKPILFLKGRIFASREDIDMYLKSHEYNEFCKINKVAPLTIGSDDIIIDEDNFESFEDLIMKDYSKTVLKEAISLSDLEKDLHYSVTSSRGKKNGLKVGGKKNGNSSSIHHNLRSQYSKILSCPSKLLDVSNFGKTIDKTHGRILDKIRDRARIEKCIVIDDFPLISTNLQSFERAIRFLGSPEYEKYVPLFSEAELNRRRETKSSAASGGNKRGRKPTKLKTLIADPSSLPLPASPKDCGPSICQCESVFPSVEQGNVSVDQQNGHKRSIQCS